MERRSGEKTSSSSFTRRHDADTWRFDPEAEAIKKDDVKFYEYLISTAIPHDRASRLYKEARSKSSFVSGTKKTDAASKPSESGKRKHETQFLPPIRT